jgi:hypothetical protein
MVNNIIFMDAEDFDDAEKMKAINEKLKPQSIKNAEPEPSPEAFINHLKNDKKRSLRTVQTYKLQLNAFIKAGGDLGGSQADILEVIKKDKNPNTQSNKLNAVQQYRLYYGLPINDLRKYREILFNEIKKQTKTNNKTLSEELPKYKYIIDKLKEMTDPRDIYINYLIIHHGLRNLDMNATFYNKKPDEMPTDENIIYKDDKGYTLYITRYKTAKRYGPKSVYIDKPQFKRAMKEMNLKDGEPIFKLKIQPWNAKRDQTGRKRDGKISDSSFNVESVARSIDKLGETKLFKVVVLYLMGRKNHQKLNQIAKDRGTSPAVIMEKYNLKNQ